MKKEKKEIKEIKLDRILEKLSPKDRIYNELEANKIIDNVIGFVPVSHSNSITSMITNLGVLIADEKIQTCIVDFKVFYPNIYKALDVEPKPKGEGLLAILRSDKIDYKREIIKSNFDNLYLLSPSPFDNIEEYFSFQLEDIQRVIKILKDMFDILLIDIPNCPPLEFCLGAIQNLNKGYLVWEERNESPLVANKLLDFVGSVGVSISKLSNVILNNRIGFEIDKSVMKNMHLQLVAELPFIPGVMDATLEGKIYIKENNIVDKRYKKGLEKIVGQIIKR